MKKPLYLLITLVLVYSCGEKVSFEEPQPAHVSALDEIPQKYWGTYFYTGDSATIEVSANNILKTTPIEISEPLDVILEELEEEEDVKIISQTDKEITFEIFGGFRQEFSLKNDSIFGTIRMPDTLFALGQQDIVKRYKNHEYFNILNSDGHYYLRKVSLEGEILTISKIKSLADIQDFTSIDKTSDNAGKGLKPTRRQFKKMTQSSFNVDKAWRRIK